MKKLEKNRSFKLIIGGAIALIFAFVFAFLGMPKAYAAATPIATLTNANMYSNRSTGNYNNWHWSRYGSSAVASNYIDYGTESPTDNSIEIIYNFSTATKLDKVVVKGSTSYVGSSDESWEWKARVCVGYKRQSDAGYTSYTDYFDSNTKTFSIADSVYGSLKDYDISSVYIYLYADYDTTYMIRTSNFSIEVYPKKETTITLDRQGGTGGSASAVGNNGEALPTISVPTKTGYTFGGYYSGQNGSGTKYYNADGTSAKNWNIDSETYTLYAKWTAKEYTVTLNKNGGTGGSNSVTATYNSAMLSVTVPTRTYYDFLGYFDAQTNGTKYYNADGTSAKNWNKTSNTTIYAQWALNASGVDALIDEIGEVTYTTESKGKIDAARSAYDALSQQKKGEVTKLAVLEAAETLYAKLKTDNEAADAVDQLILAIGEVSYPTSGEKITAARSAYDLLTEDQKELVDNYQTLLDAEARYNELMAAFNTATPVVNKIAAIGEVTYPTSKDKIDAARSAYDALTTDDERGFVNNYQTLLDAETEFNNQKVTGANNVKTLINAIGTVTYPNSYNAINDARDAYDNLTEEQKALVDNYQVLLDAEAAYKELEDQAYAANVDALIEAIGTVTYPTSLEAIRAARDAYDNLTEEQKALVTKLNDLVAKENKYDALGVEALINAIGEISDIVYPDSGDTIKTARDAYDALPDIKKALVSNYQHLIDAENKYISLNTVGLINNIGTVEYTEASKNKIDSARESYDALTDDQKALVTNYKTLTDAEALYAKLKADNEAADSVDALILAIGIVTYPNSLGAITAAIEAYNSLTDDQKALVDNYDKLTLAKDTYDQLELNATRHSLDDEDTGVEIETSDGIGIPKTITLKVEVKTTVSAEKGTEGYTNITAQIKGNEKISGVYDVKLIQTIDGVEMVVQPSDIKAGTKIVIHIEIPKGVNPNETRILHIHSSDDIEYVDDVEVIDNEFVFEVSRLSEFALVTKKHGLPGYAIALVVAGSLWLFIALVALCYVLLLFVFNKWIVVDDKVVRVFKLWHKEDTYMLFVMPCFFKKYKEEEIFDTKEEALIKLGKNK